MTTPHYLILDNDEINSDVLIHVLEFIGEFTYQIYTKPIDLIKALQNNKPDIIFCNVTAKGCDIRELCHRNEIDIPLIFISVLYKSEERRKCFLESEHPYITTPLTTEKIQTHL